MRKFASLLSLAAVIAAPSMLSAQSDSNLDVGASATVLQTIQVVAGRDLAFGKVGQSTNKTVAADDATSGRFSVVGQGAARYELQVLLPANLTNQIVLGFAIAAQFLIVLAKHSCRRPK